MEYRTGGMQEMWNTGKEGCWKCGIQDRRDAGDVEYRTGGIHDRWDAGQVGC